MASKNDAPPKPTATITCNHCGHRNDEAKPGKEGPKLPRGWQRYGNPEAVWCAECWSKSFVIRAVEIPVAAPLNGRPKDLWDSLGQGWRAATQVSNWLTTELARRDKLGTFGQTTALPMAKFDPYKGAIAVANPSAPEKKKGGTKKQAVPGEGMANRLAPTSITALTRAVEKRYRKKRHEVLVLYDASLPVYRYPQPVPFHNQSWWCERGPGGRACISVLIGSRRWTLALRTGKRWRQLAAWKDMLEGGPIKRGELSLRRAKAEKSDHRSGFVERESGGGKQRRYQIMAKLVGWFPRKPSGELDGTLHVMPCAGHFLAYRIGDDGELRYLDGTHLHRMHAEHMRRLIANTPGIAEAHERHRRSIGNDLKREKRFSRKLRIGASERLEDWSAKYNNRMESYCHEVAAILAKFAERNKLAAVVFDDSQKTKSGFKAFRWDFLKSKLAEKLTVRGIAFVDANKKKERGDEQPEAMAE